jgi:hypothetical protein
MTKDEALRLALEALQNPWKAGPDGVADAIIAIKAALETKEEPWEKFCDSHCVWTDHHPDCKLAKNEPVAWINGWGDLFKNPDDVERGQTMQPLYTTPPQRTWVGLTDEEIRLQWSEFWEAECHPWAIEFARDIEAKLKAKNT